MELSLPTKISKNRIRNDSRPLAFRKYSGCGNDFILIDNRKGIFPVVPDYIVHLCRRKHGIGADGVILLEHSGTADFKMRIFNADGTEAEMCGNGIRCLLKFIRDLGYTNSAYKIETMHGRHHQLQFNGEEVQVGMPIPTEIRWDIYLTVGQSTWKIHHLDTGVPHAVLFVENIDQIDLENLGPKIRHHPKFAPRGANVNFASRVDSTTLRLRTFERGVEAETQACGTGATATAIAAAHEFGMSGPIQLITRSGQTLVIHFKREEGSITDVVMSGPATFVFSGEIPSLLC